ncbi:MAG TPA: transporter substrate-binding domain-containing protein [Steroidobacteraceae bacterium]|nr:transporter substrate-binding domain-containing protein [Steroidobacteraceae bacterium]
MQLPESGAAAFALAPWKGDLDGMIERRYIRVLTTYSRTSFLIDQGTQRGLVPDAFRLFEDDLNKKLKNKHLRVQVVFVPVAHDELVPALLEGRGDVVAAGTLISDWRKESVDFTNPTRSGVAIIPVTGPGKPPVATVQDLAGRELYLRRSELPRGAVDRFNADLAKAGKAPVRVRYAPEVLSDEDMLEMVNAGLVEATLVEDYIAEFWKQVFPDIVLNPAAAVRTDGQVGMMVRKGSPQLLAELNAFLARYPQGSLTRNVLLQKYLKSVKYAKSATSGDDIQRFREVVGFLRKYGDQYGIDYLLVAAQGYQESGLDHTRRSHVGAIGVMQVMPKTGAEMKVGDVRQIEPNIHAGVKYIRFMMDHYYANEPMDALNKGLFAFASYNAGPARIRGLREKAAVRGLDPNKWFNNVEVVAAESIGRETVQYVSNIYKYYLAYQMVVENMKEVDSAKAAH